MRFAFVAAAVLTCTAAQAQVRNVDAAPAGAALALTNALWQVEDLAPDDGIAPLVSLTMTGGFERVQQAFAAGGGTVFETRFEPGATWWSGMPSRTGVYATDGAGVAVEHSLLRLAHAVTVTPNTRVTAIFDVQASGGSVSEALQIGERTFSDAVTNGARQIRFTFETGAAGARGSLQEGYNADAPWSEGRVLAQGVSPVPEPATYALVLGGLAALALRRRSPTVA